MPSQATAYKIGMMRILELREKGKKSLGENSISVSFMKLFEQRQRPARRAGGVGRRLDQIETGWLKFI